MLKPAQLYTDELKKKSLESLYDLGNKYWSGSTGDSILCDLPDNNYDSHHFVSVNSSGGVIGYICYQVDWIAMSADRFGIISYDKGNPAFAKDVNTAIINLFTEYHMNRIEWMCYADNTALRGYRNFIKKHGGRECGYHRQVSKLLDGKLHDSIDFEILASEFKR